MGFMTPADEAFRDAAKPTDQEVEAAVLEGTHPFGMPAKSIGKLNLQDQFAQSMLGKGVNTTHENTVIKSPGSEEIHLPEGFEHMEEAISMMVADQQQENPLYKHALVSFTFRETTSTSRNNQDKVHIDPSRAEQMAINEGQSDFVPSVAEDYVYFVASQDGTLVQAEYVKDPETTLNRMIPQIMLPTGLLRQAEDFEVVRGTEQTYHRPDEVSHEGRKFIRVIFSHPDIDYFHALSDDEKAELPAEFREKHSIALSSDALSKPGLT